MARLSPPTSATFERSEIVRKRTFHARTPEDVYELLKTFKREGAIGSLTLHLGPGGTVNSVVMEERTNLRS